MKYLKTILEALEDEISSPMRKQVGKVWGQRFLKLDTVDKSDHIKTGKWKLSDEDRNLVIDTYFKTNIGVLKAGLNKLPPKLGIDIYESTTAPDQRKIWEKCNISHPTLKQIISLFGNNFRLIDWKASLDDKMILKDGSGTPVRDENGSLQHTPKPAGEIVWTKNYVNIRGFMDAWFKCNESVPANNSLYSDYMNGIYNVLKTFDKILDFDVFSEDPIYLLVTSKPTDILNMSVSQFFTSCQNLWGGGGYMSQLLINVFDKNMVPSFLIFDTPYKDNKGKILNKFTPLCRSALRELDDHSGNPHVYVDLAYPNSMHSLIFNMLNKYTPMKVTRERTSRYKVLADIDPEEGDSLHGPYMDTLSQDREYYFGKNTRSVDIRQIGIYGGKANIGTNNRIETIVVPSGSITMSSDLKLEIDKLRPKLPRLKWIEIQNSSIDRIDIKSAIYENRLCLLRCSIDDIFEILHKVEGIDQLKALKLYSCHGADTTILPDISFLKNLEELELSWTYSIIDSVVNLHNLKEITISKNMIKSNQETINRLTEKGVKISYEGI